MSTSGKPCDSQAALEQDVGLNWAHEGPQYDTIGTRMVCFSIPWPLLKFHLKLHGMRMNQYDIKIEDCWGRSGIVSVQCSPHPRGVHWSLHHQSWQWDSLELVEFAWTIKDTPVHGLLPAWLMLITDYVIIVDIGSIRMYTMYFTQIISMKIILP
jgi:hypothetical protein